MAFTDERFAFVGSEEGFQQHQARPRFGSGLTDDNGPTAEDRRKELDDWMNSVLMNTAAEKTGGVATNEDEEYAYIDDHAAWPRAKVPAPTAVEQRAPARARQPAPTAVEQLWAFGGSGDPGAKAYM